MKHMKLRLNIRVPASVIRTCLYSVGIFLILGCTSTPDDGKNTDYPWNGIWSLVFEENFDGSVLNPEYWTAIEQGASWNNEDQAYIPDNAAVQDGYLRIISKQEVWTGPTNLPYHPEDPGTVTRKFTSAHVESRHKKSWTYGRFEIRARMEDTPGMLNALWMGADSGNWPPEIDISEILGNDPDKLYMTNHYGTQSDHQSNSGNYQSSAPFSDDFHVFAVEWEPGIIRWYLDGAEVFRSTKGVPDEPFFLMLCPAIGPDWTGNPTSQSKFPLLFEVDWIKVYQRKVE